MRLKAVILNCSVIFVVSSCTSQTSSPSPGVVVGDAAALSYFQLAQEEAQKEHLVESERALRKALQLAPHSDPIGYSLGVVLEQLQDFAQAEEVFGRLPDNPRRAAALRRLHLRNGDSKAIAGLEADYNAALLAGDFPNAAKLGRALAGVYGEFGRLSEAASLLYEVNQY